MKISVYLDKVNKTSEVELDENSEVKDLLKNLKINPVEVIVSRNNELILEEEKLKDSDEVRILSVISGG
jgi:sulfur carrier protein